MSDMYSSVFDLGCRRESMAMEGAVVYDRLLRRSYMYELTFLLIKRHLSVRIQFSRLLRSSWSLMQSVKL